MSNGMLAQTACRLTECGCELFMCTGWWCRTHEIHSAPLTDHERTYAL